MPAKAVYDLALAIRLNESGLTLRQIGSRPDMPSWQTVRRGILESGHKIKQWRRKLRGVSRELLLDMSRNRRMTYREIASELGCGVNVVARSFSEFGIGLGKGVGRRPRSEKSHQWKGGRRTSRLGYVWVHAPSHPNALCNGYVSEHRLVMSQKLGRALTPDEHVHHIDGNKRNNHPDNLETCSASEHKREHASIFKELLAVRKEVEQLRAEVNRLRGEDTYQRLRTYAG